MDSLLRRAKEKYREERSAIPHRSAARLVLEKVGNLTSIDTVHRRTFGEVIEHRGVQLYWKKARAGVEVKLRLILGMYETAEADLINEHLSRTMDVIELGGGIGFTSCYINKQIDSSTTQIVVEANARLLPVLEANAELNNCEFDVVNAAYSLEDDPVRFSPVANYWGGSLYRDGDESMDVKSTNIEDLIEEFDLSTFALIVDIEGAEIDLLTSELDVLEAHCELLIVEFHDGKREYKHIADSIQFARTTLDDSRFSFVENRGNVAVYRTES